MKIVKYIINESGIPILFGMSTLHCEMITVAVSAGFAIVDYDILADQFRVKCYGGSESLKLNSDRNDCIIIRNYLNNLLCKLDVDDSLSCSEFNHLLSKKE